MKYFPGIGGFCSRLRLLFCLCHFLLGWSKMVVLSWESGAGSEWLKNWREKSLLVEMNLFRVVCWVVWCLGFVGAANVTSSRPAIVNIGAIFNLDSILGKVAKITLEEAVKDVNADTSILHGTKIVLTMQNSNYSGFLGMVQGDLFYSVLKTQLELKLSFVF